MERAKFDAIFPIITSALINKIAVENVLSEDEAIESLYESKLYAELENEKTKIWQYSTEMLYELYRREKETGRLDLPEY